MWLSECMVYALVSVAYNNNAVRWKASSHAGGQPGAVSEALFAKRVFPTGSVRRVFQFESGTD